MKDELELSRKKIGDLESKVANTDNVLKAIIENQISLEIHLQELIKSKHVQTVAINSASKIDFIPVKEIVYCSANLAYTEVISLNNNKVTATKSINEFEEHFANHSFFRISKSLLVNIDHIHSFNKRNNQVLMKNNDLLDVARRRKTEFVATILKR